MRSSKDKMWMPLKLLEHASPVHGSLLHCLELSSLHPHSQASGPHPTRIHTSRESPSCCMVSAIKDFVTFAASCFVWFR